MPLDWYSADAWRRIIAVDVTPTPLTWGNIPSAHWYLLPYFLMAFLTRRPRTMPFRLLLLPFAISVILRCTFQYRIENPVYGWYNWLRGLVACVAIAKATHFATAPQGFLKVGEEHFRVPRFQSRNEVATKADILFLCISDALEVGMTARGIGWQFAQGVHVPRARRPKERNAYLMCTSTSILKTFLLADLFDSLLETLPGITVSSGTIFFPSLPPVTRYTVSTVLHTITGVFIIRGLQMLYDIASLIGVGVFRRDPSLWPPVHDEPWRMTSLHEFWAKRWHQLLRDTFLVLGGYPAQYIAGNIGMLFGTFLASGLFHEVGFYLGGTPMDARVIVFFVSQAFGVLGEKLFKSITGKKIGGWGGTVWASIFVLGIGQICTDSWVARGAGGKALIPPAVSPARRLLFPIFQDMGFHTTVS
ncbi:hypothetical protein C8Q78DRAFT_1191645 [Trametes maxima]|nr:hypothetical protein C8Q78DRAFT_1191645 [Trametes maxima]